MLVSGTARPAMLITFAFLAAGSRQPISRRLYSLVDVIALTTCHGMPPSDAFFFFLKYLPNIQTSRQIITKE
jgi:hypothetical protein